MNGVGTVPARAPNPLLEAALAYASHGWSVLPLFWRRDSGECACGDPACKSAGKHPLGAAVPRGLKQATTDPGVIRSWWERHPSAHVGLATGGELAVVDVDPRHGGDETLRELERIYGPLPDTPMVMTPSGGWHLYLRKSGFLKTTTGQLGAGVDTRGDGGYVVAPPSRGYIWDVARGLALPLGEAPMWVYRLAQRRATEPSSASEPSGAPDRFIEGGRNSALTSLAGVMRRKGMTGEEILAALLVVNERRCRPVLDPAEVKGIAYGVERYVAADPVRPCDAPAPKYLDPIERARRLGLRGTRMPTSFPTLDKAMRGGPLSGRTIVVGGAPGAGKTTLLVQLCRHYAMNGHPALVVASDEEADGLLIRWGQNENLEREDLERGDDAARDVLVERLSFCPLLMIVDQDEDDALFEDAVQEFARRLAALPEPAKRPVIGADSLQTLRCRGSDEARSVRERLDVHVRAIKRAAKSLDALALVTSEVGRGFYGKGDKQESTDYLAAFKESGGIEYGVSAGLVLLNVPDSGGQVDVVMPKNRMGPMLGFRLAFDHRYARFVEIGAAAEVTRASAALPAEERLRRVERRIVEVLRKRPVGMGFNEIAELVEGRRQSVTAALERLCQRGAVTARKDGQKLRYWPVNDVPTRRNEDGD